MRVVHQELLATFVLLTLLSVVITCMLVAATLGTDSPEIAGDLTTMVTLQGEAIERVGGLWLRVAFLLGGSFVIFSTQLAIPRHRHPHHGLHFLRTLRIQGRASSPRSARSWCF